MALTRYAPVLPAALLLAGCTTTLQSMTLQPAGVDSAPVTGYAYQLPDLAYAIEVSRTITECKDDGVEFELAAKAVAEFSPGRTVVIDPRALGSPTKTISFETENHPNGMLKTVNVAVEDRSGAVVGEVVKAVVGVVKLTIGASGGAPTKTPGMLSPAERQVTLACTPLAEQNLQLFDSRKSLLKQATASLKAASAALADFDAKHPAPLSGADAKDREAKAKAVKEAAEALELIEKAYQAAKEPLTATHRFRFSPTHRAWRVDTLSPEQDGEFVSTNLRIRIVDKPAGAAAGSETFVDITPQLKPAADLEPLDSAVTRGGARTAARLHPTPVEDLLKTVAVVLTEEDLSAGAGPAAWETRFAQSCGPGGDQTPCGILYRTQALGRLQICRGDDKDACFANRSEPKNRQVLVRDDRVVPQFGRLMSLPLVNGPFMNNTLKAEFREDGVLAKYSYTKPSTEGEGFFQAFNTVIGGAQSIQAERDAAQLAALQRNTALNEARLKDRETAAALEESELARVQGDAALRDALKARREAQIALKESQRRYDAP